MFEAPGLQFGKTIAGCRIQVPHLSLEVGFDYRIGVLFRKRGQNRQQLLAAPVLIFRALQFLNSPFKSHNLRGEIPLRLRVHPLLLLMYCWRRSRPPAKRPPDESEACECSKSKKIESVKPPVSGHWFGG